MKKTLLFLIAAGVLFAASCSKDNAPEKKESIKLNLTISGPSADTKAAKKNWAAGDKLNIWFNVAENQTVPDLIITYDGTKWNAGSLRTGCSPAATGKFVCVYEGYNDLSSYSYSWYSNSEWFNFKRPKEKPESWDSYCSPLVISTKDRSLGISYTFTSNTLTATIKSDDWLFRTLFKVLIKNHASLKDADYYNLQVHDITNGTYAHVTGSFIIAPTTNPTYAPEVRSGAANNYGWAGGVQESDGIAFYYYGFTTSDAEITFKLKEYGGTEKTYTVTGKTIAAQNDRCIGIALDYTSFH